MTVISPLIKRKIDGTSMPVQDSDSNKKKWFFCDLNDKVVGRVAVMVANTLRGKNKSFFTPNTDVGDFVVLVNAKRIKINGKNKPINKVYYNHSGYLGNLRQRTLKEMKKSFSTELVRRVVKGMMPKNRLSRKQLRRLFVFEEEKHHLTVQEKSFIPLI